MCLNRSGGQSFLFPGAFDSVETVYILEQI